ncbi:MAG TPA: hypothetical protein DC061_16930 [Gemmobacter sp.]|nr:hypothetical protein [Gemmobacter sp.]
MTKIDLKGIHRVRMKLRDGSRVEYHYAWRGKGAPCFWKSGSGIEVGSPAYIDALAAATPKGGSAKGLFREIIIRFLDSAEFKRLAPRTQSDMAKSIRHSEQGIDHKFGGAPSQAFNDPRIRRQALAWRDKIGGKVGDDRIRHLQRIVGWAVDRGHLLQNHLTGIASIYQSKRSEIIWTQAEIDAFVAGAPAHVGDILIAATETGLRPGDLHVLSRQHIHPTPGGRRIVIWTAKRRKLASLPVTPRMAELLDRMPEGRDRVLVNKGGEPYQHENYLGDAVSTWRDKLKIRAADPADRRPRLYDARGTAATRLLQAGAEMKEIATAMGWSIKQASEVIEHYVALSPEMADGLAEKLAKAEARTKL